MATSTRPSYNPDVDPIDPASRTERVSIPPADLGRRSPSSTGTTGWIVLAVLALVVAAVLIGYSNSARVTAPVESSDTTTTEPAPALPDATATPPGNGSSTQPSEGSETSPSMSQPPAVTQPAPSAPAPAPPETQQQ